MGLRGVWVQFGLRRVGVGVKTMVEKRSVRYGIRVKENIGAEKESRIGFGDGENWNWIRSKRLFFFTFASVRRPH